MTVGTSLCIHEFFRSQINPITYPNPVYRHLLRDIIVYFSFLGWGETESTWYVGH
jgi:hypothetical protein